MFVEKSNPDRQRLRNRRTGVLESASLYTIKHIHGASLIAKLVKNPPAMQETPVWFLVRKIPWRRDRLPIPVFWPGEFHGLYSPWGHKESNMTEWLSHIQTHISQRTGFLHLFHTYGFFRRIFILMAIQTTECIAYCKEDHTNWVLKKKKKFITIFA